MTTPHHSKESNWEERFDESHKLGGAFKDIEIMLRSRPGIENGIAEHISNIKDFIRAELLSVAKETRGEAQETYITAGARNELDHVLDILDGMGMREEGVERPDYNKGFNAAVKVLKDELTHRFTSLTPPTKQQATL